MFYPRNCYAIFNEKAFHVKGQYGVYVPGESPGHAGLCCRVDLGFDVRGEGGLDLDYFLSAEVLLDPADDGRLGQVLVGDEIFWALEPDGSVGAGRVESALVAGFSYFRCRGRGPVGGENIAVSGLALEVGDVPVVSDCHGKRWRNLCLIGRKFVGATAVTPCLLASRAKRSRRYRHP